MELQDLIDRAKPQLPMASNYPSNTVCVIIPIPEHIEFNSEEANCVLGKSLPNYYELEFSKLNGSGNFNGLKGWLFIGFKSNI